jgi:hypothetical protein
MRAKHSTITPPSWTPLSFQPRGQGSNYALPPIRVINGSRERSHASVHKFPMETPQLKHTARPESLDSHGDFPFPSFFSLVHCTKHSRGGDLLLTRYSLVGTFCLPDTPSWRPSACQILPLGDLLRASRLSRCIIITTYSDTTPTSFNRQYGCILSSGLQGLRHAHTLHPCNSSLHATRVMRCITRNVPMYFGIKF